MYSYFHSFNSFSTSVLLFDYFIGEDHWNMLGAIKFGTSLPRSKNMILDFDHGGFLASPSKASQFSLENLVLDGRFGNLDIRNTKKIPASSTMVLQQYFGMRSLPYILISILKYLYKFVIQLINIL